MRMLMLTGGLLTLAGCAGFGMPAPDPAQAWIDLGPKPQDTALQALKVDDKATTANASLKCSPAAMN